MGASALNLVHHLFRSPQHVGQTSPMIEVDITDSDGGILSIAAVEPNFWNANSTQAEALAVRKGLDFYVPGGPPAATAAERNVYSMGDIQNWLASMGSVGVVYRPPSKTTPGAVAAAALAPPMITTTTAPAMSVTQVIRSDLGRFWSWIRSKL